MKVQIDQNNYLTGNYAMVGDLTNSIEMSALPNDDMVFFPAYQILSRIIEEKIIVNEPVLKQREVEIPVLDEEGNPTGETTTTIEEYYEIEPVEKIIERTEYYYELDETKKQQIQDKINNPDPPDTSNDWKFQYDKLQETMVTQISNIEYIALMTDIDIWNI